MNKSIASVITDYLKDTDTDYALMINGAWGSGKTFFIKNALKLEIEKIVCPIQKDNDKRKNYKQLYVSLYGVSSVGEIKERIFYAINPKFKWLEIVSNKIVSAAEGIPMLGGSIKGILSYSKKEKAAIRDAITNYADKVLFFDDLERIDKDKIDTQTVLGYINSLTEHNHYKVVVVANDEILDNEYKQFKEKTIRFSYCHSPKMADIFDSVCEKFKENEQYKTFLNEQKQFILDIISAGACKNIRTLIFIMDIYQKIFRQTDGEYSKEINQDLLLPFVIISIEAKKGHTKEELKDVLQSINTLSFMHFLPSQEQDDNKQSTPKGKYEQELKVKYERFKNGRTIQFYDILFDLVYDGYVVPADLSTIISDIRNTYLANKETEESKLVEQIRNWTLISDDEFLSVVERLRSNVSSNKYGVFDLLRIYAAFIQIDTMGICDFRFSENDTDTFKKAIDNSMTNQPYSSSLAVKLPSWDETDKSEAGIKYNDLRQYVLEINDKNEEKSKLNEKCGILHMMRDNKAEQFKRFFAEYANKVLFVDIQPEDLIAELVVASAEIKQVFLWGLTGFFHENLANPSQDDLDYLEKMSEVLNNYLNKQTMRKVSLANLFRIQNYLNKVIGLYKRRLSMQ